MKYIIVFLSILTLFSCSKSDGFRGDGEYLVFGAFFGECSGERCIETFKLTDTKLYEDELDTYGIGERDFKEIGADKFELAKGLTSKVPSQLLDADEQTFGCPDCGDWGGIIVQYYDGGDLKSWTIDIMKDDIPSYLHDFTDDILETLNAINE